MAAAAAEITISYFTCRKEPRIEWFFRSLNRELKGDWSKVQVLIIDYWHQYDAAGREAQFRPFWEVYEGCHVQHISPKPSPWQGKHRVTANDYFAASNARNTAFLHCNTPYIVCIDDLTVIKEGWYNVVRWGHQHGHVVLGSYAKVKKLDCDADGKFSFEEHPPGMDSRYNHQGVTDNFATRVAGSWLFGCSFGLPLRLAMEVDGFDEACDGQGAEDYDFGIRLGRVTPNIFYSRQMFTYEDEDLHFTADNVKFVRESKMLTEATAMPKYIGMKSDHAMLQHVMVSGRLPFLPNDLKAGGSKDLEVDAFKDKFKDKKDWRDGMSLIDM